MPATGIVLSIVGLGFFCWLLFTLAIYALPTFAGLAAGLAAFHSGAGVAGAIAVGLLMGAAILALGQFVFAATRTPLRAVVALAYIVPAAVAGYQVSFALAGLGMPGSVWQAAFAVIGAVVSGCTAFLRLALLVQPPDGRGTVSACSPANERVHGQGSLTLFRLPHRTGWQRLGR